VYIPFIDLYVYGEYIFHLVFGLSSFMIVLGVFYHLNIKYRGVFPFWFLREIILLIFS
jgi:hypothetical protein